MQIDRYELALNDTIQYCPVLFKIVQYCPRLPNIVIYCHILLNIVHVNISFHSCLSCDNVRNIHILSNIIKYCLILLGIDEYCLTL